MTDFLDQYAVQFRAAAEAQAARRRRGRRSLRLAPAALAALAVVAAGLTLPGRDQGPPPDEVEQPARVVKNGGYAEQKALLGVLREPTAADRDPQVRKTVREFRELRPRAGRLLGFAPSGSAYVLLATRSYQETTFRRTGPVTRRRRDGLCLVRRGTQGGAGTCLGTAAVSAGDFAGALAGQAYGLVPDGVTHVRPPGADRPVRVRRNFYAYPVRGRYGPPVWLDAGGQEVARTPPPGSFAYLNHDGHSRADFRDRVTVLVIWASWCEPCVEQLRRVQRVQVRLNERGAEVTGVAAQDRASAARSVIDENRIDIPVLHDPEARIARRLGVDTYPQTLVIGLDGVVAARHRGLARTDEIERSVAAAMP